MKKYFLTFRTISEADTTDGAILLARRLVEQSQEEFIEVDGV